MKLVSWNVNGLRAIQKKGFEEYLKEAAPDVLGLQEIKANATQVDMSVSQALGYRTYWHSAKRPGYSGVAIMSKIEPDNVVYGIGRDEFDDEGRIILAEWKHLALINAYFPNSQSEGKRLAYKLLFCEAMEETLSRVRKRKPVVLCGDLNIAHKEIDLKNPKENEKSAGYLPEERAWMSHLLTLPYVDIFRKLHPQVESYTWWSYRMNARIRNIGWRIDYHVIDERLEEYVLGVSHQCDKEGSDHCPVQLELKAFF